MKLWNSSLTESKIFHKVEGIYSLSTDSDGKRLVVLTPNRLTEIYDINDGSLLIKNTSHSFAKVILIGNTNNAVVKTYGQGVQLIDLENNKTVFEFPVGIKIKDILLSDNQEQLYISLIGYSLHVFDLSKEPPAPLKKIRTEFSGGTNLSINGNLLVTWNSAFIESLKLPEMTPLYATEQTKQFGFFELSPSGTSALAHHDDKLFLYSIQGNDIIPLKKMLILETSHIDLRALHFLSDKKAILVGAMKTSLLDIDSFKIEEKFDFPGTLLSVLPKFCCHGKYLTTVGKDSEITVFDTENGDILARFLPTTFVEEAVISPDLTLIATRAVPAEIYRLKDRKRLFALRKGIFDLVFSDNGKFLYGFNNDGVVGVDIAKMEITFKVKIPGAVSKFVLSDNIGIAFSNRGLFVVDILSGKIISEWKKQDLEVCSVSFRGRVCLFQDANKALYRVEIPVEK